MKIIIDLSNMKKEEQQQNLYRLLLQKNQLNLEIIRKYFKKSTNYHKRITAQRNITGESAKQLELIKNKQQKDEQAKVQEGTVQNSKKCLEEKGTKKMASNMKGKKEEQQLQELQRSKQLQQQKQNKKQILKLPSINGHINNNANADKAGERSKLSIKMQISLALGSQPPMNRQSLQKMSMLRIVTQENEKSVHEENTSKSCNINNMSDMKISKLGQIKSFRHQTLQSSTQNSNHSIYGNSKREVRLSNSHKALLNLQQIIFQNSNIKEEKDLILKDRESIKEMIDKYRSRSKNKNNKSFIKYKKYEDYYKEYYLNTNQNSRSCNGEEQQIGRIQSLTNITNTIHNTNTNNSSVMGSCKNINIGYMHTIAYINTNVPHNSTNQKAKNENENMNFMGKKTATKSNQANTSNPKNIPQISILSISSTHNSSNPNTKQQNNSNATTGSSLNNNQKLPQMLPHLRKLKEFKLNFHRLVKKQCINAYQTNLHNLTNQGGNGNNYWNIGSSIISNSYNSMYSNIPNMNNGNGISNMGSMGNTNNPSYSTVACTGVGTDCRDDLVEVQGENSKRLFKIQAIPVHQIKWA